MFESTRALAPFDYFRVPYSRVDERPVARELESLSARGCSATLSWPAESGLASERPGRYFLGSSPLFGRVASDDKARAWLRRTGRTWHPVEDVCDDQGNVVGAVWKDDNGSALL